MPFELPPDFSSLQSNSAVQHVKRISNFEMLSAQPPPAQYMRHIGEVKESFKTIKWKTEAPKDECQD